MYRPTVRMDDAFQVYVNNLYHATLPQLDRNMIIRLALFTAPYSGMFQDKLAAFRKDVPLPCPGWSRQEDSLWIRQERGGASNEIQPSGIQAQVGSKVYAG